MKNKFNRHFLKNMQTGGTLVFVHILALTVPFIRWYRDGEFSFELFLQFGIIIPFILYLMYFGVGFYCVFQTVIINNEGIEIWLFKKCLKKYPWNKISRIEESWHMRNPALKITLVNDYEIYLEKRKPIIRAIEYYSAIKIEKSTPPPPHFMKEYK